jgi:hypothetical protein
MSDLPHDAKSSYEHTRTTEPDGRMLPPWEKLGIEMRIALINAYSFGASRALDMIASKGRCNALDSTLDDEQRPTGPKAGGSDV